MQNNIDQAGIKSRRLVGIIGIVLSVLILSAILIFKPNLAYLVLLLPSLYIAFIGFIQSKKSFCVFHGLKGETNLNGTICKLERKDKSKSLTRSIRIIFKSLLFAFLLWITLSLAILTVFYSYSLKDSINQGNNILSEIGLVKNDDVQIINGQDESDLLKNAIKPIPICLVCTSAELDSTGNCPTKNIFYRDGLMYSGDLNEDVIVDDNQLEEGKYPYRLAEEVVNKINENEYDYEKLTKAITEEGFNKNIISDDYITLEPNFDDIIIQPVYLSFDTNTNQFTNQISYLDKNLRINWKYRLNDTIYNIGDESVDFVANEGGVSVNEKSEQDESKRESDDDLLDGNDVVDREIHHNLVLLRNMDTGWLIGDYIFSVYSGNSIVENNDFINDVDTSVDSSSIDNTYTDADMSVFCTGFVRIER
ncbi:MAG TPA: hypothetical protein PKJ86_03075 [Candidatus Dojkabacteria bacterium]|nr:hypothetical protein [Candidatus Dojkabacteria bacterium]